MKKKILLTLLAILVIIQFIRPSKNHADQMTATDISKHYTVPDNVQAILNKACNDCHSNNTAYPWYTNIQPVGWWMQWHVNEGKKNLNFSEFASNPPKKQHKKLEDLIKEVKEGGMPLDSYTWIHKDAILSQQEKNELMDWANGMRKEIAAKNNLSPEEIEK